MTTQLTLPPPALPASAAPQRDPADDPSRGRRRLTWVHGALAALLVGTAVLYLWDLSSSGYANSFYAAAAQAGSTSWKAWFFGALDSAGSITVDKPPASLWVMGLSGRIFGFSSWSLLVPQALEGVAAVALLFATVRRWAGPVAGLAAGAALALTPAAVLMFRFDNPDALLTLLLVAGAYGLTRAVELASSRWLALVGVALGFAFLTKMLQGFLVLPAFALVYLVAAPTRLRRRIGHLLAAGLALVVSAGWWVAAVALWPASSRPYIGGSTNNSVLELVFGYNGFGRLFGATGNGGGGTATGTSGSSFGGATGLTRLFGSEMGNEISWLLPAALVALVAGLWVTRRAPRTDRTRAALLMWGGWLVVTAGIFSYMKGVIHPYYTVALAPAIAGLVAVGGHSLWVRRGDVVAQVGLAAMTAAAGGWSYVLLARNASWHPELRYAVLAVTVVVGLGLLAPRARVGRTATALALAAVLTGSAGAAAYGVATASHAHTGSIPSAGPTSASSSGGGMGGMSGMGGGGTGGAGGAGNGGPTGTRPSSSSSTTSSSSSSSTTTSSTTSLTATLKATTATWAAATVGDQSAAELELSSGKAVMAIGGWSGSDPSITLAQFTAEVAAGKIAYFVAGSQGGGGAGGGGQSSGVATQITSWVTSHYTATTVGGQTVYHLVGQASG